MRIQLICIGYICLLMSSSSAFADSTKLIMKENHLQLASFTQEVLAKNPKVQQMRTAYQSAQTRIVQVSAYPDPMISYSLAPQSIFNNKIDYGHIITASQQIPWPGKQKIKGEIAQWQANASEENIASLRLALIAASKRVYADWQFVHAALKINQQNVTLLEEFKNIAEIKYSAGRASKQDVLRSEVEIALLSRKEETLNRQKSTISSQINTLLNLEANRSVLPPVYSPTIEIEININRLNQLILKHHPMLKQIDAQLMASQKHKTLAERNFFPDLKFSASYNSLRMNNSNRFTVGVGINLPLQAKRHSAVDEASLNSMTISWKKQALIADIKNQLQQHYSRLLESQRIIKLYEIRLLPLADENLQAARSDYESGQGNFLNMITAEQNLIQVQLQLEQTRADYLRRFAMLEESVGGNEVMALASDKGELL